MVKIYLKRLFTTLIVVLILAVPFFSHAQEPVAIPNTPIIVLNTEKKIYQKGEEISLEAVLDYQGNTPMEIAIPLFCLGNGLSLKDKNGKSFMNLAKKAQEGIAEIKNGDSFTDTLMIKTDDWEPGVYALQYTLLVNISAENDPSPKVPNAVYSNVVGYVSSDPLKIEIAE